MDSSKRELIYKDFLPIIEDVPILGIFLFGSTVHNDQGRDIDVCIIAGTGNKDEIQSILSQAMRLIDSNKYDLWIFEELKIYMQDEVLKNHQIIWTENKPQLYEYLYDFRKLIEDYHYRLRVAYGEM